MQVFHDGRVRCDWVIWAPSKQFHGLALDDILTDLPCQGILDGLLAFRGLRRYRVSCTGSSCSSAHKSPWASPFSRYPMPDRGLAGRGDSGYPLAAESATAPAFATDRFGIPPGHLLGHVRPQAFECPPDFSGQALKCGLVFCLMRLHASFQDGQLLDDILHGRFVRSLNSTTTSRSHCSPAPTAICSRKFIHSASRWPCRDLRISGQFSLTEGHPSDHCAQSPPGDAVFEDIKDLDRQTDYAIPSIRFHDVPVTGQGDFSDVQPDGVRIQGGFYGPGHVETVGVFEHSGIVGAFGARKP